MGVWEPRRRGLAKASLTRPLPHSPIRFSPFVACLCIRAIPRFLAKLILLCHLEAFRRLFVKILGFEYLEFFLDVSAKNIRPRYDAD